MSEVVFTVGHSNHDFEKIVGLLTRHRVAAVADVRSAPYSRRNPHFNREPLAHALREAGLDYVYLGYQLGGRPKDPTCYEERRVIYERVVATVPFRKGIERVRFGARTSRIALMCAEKEPLQCHRTLLVAPALDALGITMMHILADGSLESHADTMERLVAKHDLTAPLFDSPAERAALIDEAISRQTKRPSESFTQV